MCTQEMLSQDLAWAENRPTSCVHDKNFQRLTSSQQAIAHESKRTRALTTQDIVFLEQYRSKFYSSCPDGRMCCVVGQDPQKHAQWIGGPLMLTVISNSPVLWAKGFCLDTHEDLERFLYPLEMLLAQGFPAMEPYTPYPAVIISSLPGAHFRIVSKKGSQDTCSNLCGRPFALLRLMCSSARSAGMSPRK